jgi:hypothetical protein
MAQGTIRTPEYLVNTAFAANTSGLIGATNVQDGAESAFCIVVSAAGAQTASYTAVMADRGTFVPFNHTTGSPTFTIPLNSSVAYPIGSVLSMCWIGSGTTAPAFLATGGVTINSPTGTLALRARYSFASAFKYATDTWVLMGDLLP